MDHDVPDNVVQTLQNLSYRVIRLREILPRTTEDSDIFRTASARSWLLMTCNIRDYAPFAKRELAAGREISGVIFLIRRRTREAECRNIRALHERVDRGGLRGAVHFA